MNVEPIDLGDKIRQGAQFCFDLAPVILCRPIARERLSGRELYALGCISNGFFFRPFCRVDASAQFGEFGFRNSDMKRTNCVLVTCLLAVLWCSTGLGHSRLLLSSWLHRVLLLYRPEPRQPQRPNQNKRPAEKQLDDGIGDTLVSLEAVRGF